MSVSHTDLLDASIQAVLASIEIYNKPDFKYREQSFTILNVNAWELLFKAKILKDNGDNLESLYVKMKEGNFKTNRSGNPMTIEILGTLRLIAELNNNVIDNIRQLVGIRDTKVHFYNDSDLDYVVYVLGVASLKNYQKLVDEWFSRNLLEYRFFIMPLSFSYSFQTLSSIGLKDKPEVIANLIKDVSETNDRDNLDDNFDFVCEIQLELTSAKNFVGEPDVKVSVNPDDTETLPFAERIVRLMKQYPLQYEDIWREIRKERPNIKQHQMNEVIKSLKLKGDKRYSSYSFLYPKHLEQYEKEGTVSGTSCCLYNRDAVKIILQSLPE
jgi:hypothetical protein